MKELTPLVLLYEIYSVEIRNRFINNTKLGYMTKKKIRINASRPKLDEIGLANIKEEKMKIVGVFASSSASLGINYVGHS
jgi:hypothetical protein